MQQIQSWRAVLCLIACSPAFSASGAEPHSIETHKSTPTVRVFKSGVFSAFGHDHTISASIASGSVDVAERRVELKVKAGSLRVVDRDASERDRAEIQQTMLGQVLDAECYPDIVFRSTGAERAGRSLFSEEFWSHPPGLNRRPADYETRSVKSGV